MRFENVAIVGLSHVDAPHRIASHELEAPLLPTYTRMGLPPRMLESLTGVRARRFWDPDVRPSDAAARAGQKVLADTNVEAARVGVLVNTSVCRDYVEPSVACFVHDRLGLSERCLNFDLGSACLGFLDGMCVVGNMIERGQIDYGLVVDAESSRYIVERTVERLSQPTCDHQMLREQIATLTVGSGAVAMLLGHSALEPSGHRFLGSVSLAATRHHSLCRGQVDVGITDTSALLTHGVELAARTWARAQEEFGWAPDTIDLYALHQVSELHTRELSRTLGFGLDKTVLVYPEFGNVGPASVPLSLSIAIEAGRVATGDRVMLGGIGSGLNCTAAAVAW